MSDVNEEMKATADYAVKSAKNRYNLILDYSEQSIAALDGILEKMYWGFSSRVDDKGKDGLIYNTAIIWGSYLGEYMRLKWGGSWKVKGTQQVISIKNKEFSPISFVYQKITGHFNYKLEDYLFETNQVVGPIQGAPKQEQYIQNYSEALEKKTSYPKEKKLVINKRYLIYAAGGLSLLIVISIGIALLVNLSKGGLPAFGLLDASTITPTSTPTENIILVPTDTEMISPSPTVTPLPTYTLEPSQIPSPTSIITPTPTGTETPTPTPSETSTASLPTYTRTSTITPTVHQVRPTNTYTSSPTNTATRAATPTNTATRSATPTNTATSVPVPTNTQPAPEILSCSVSPSSINPLEPTSLTFTVRFSVPGYGMSVSGFNPEFPGQQKCSDGNTDGDSTASCVGQSGYIPAGIPVTVGINTDLGNCTTTYQAP